MPGSATKQHRILFVDDDQEFLETISQLFLAWSQGTWQVHLATSSTKALAVLEEHPVDLVVMDVQMPVMDGLQFLTLLNRKHPALRKVMLSGLTSVEQRANCLGSGAELFLEKPRSREGFETVFATLNELASLQPQEGFRGVLRQVGLQDIIQMECLSRNSSILEISITQARGRIYIEQGNIIHAEMGALSGEAAFNNLLCLRGGEFNLKPFTPPAMRTIEGRWEFLLLEAARLRDELAELGAGPATAPATLPAGAPVPPPQEATSSSPPPDRAGTSPETATRIDEFLLCSGLGEVLHEWQCKDIPARLKLFALVAQRAGQWAQSFSLGRFDRVEALGQSRLVLVIAPDRKVLVRTTGAPVAPETATDSQ